MLLHQQDESFLQPLEGDITLSAAWRDSIIECWTPVRPYAAGHKLGLRLTPSGVDGRNWQEYGLNGWQGNNSGLSALDVPNLSAYMSGEISMLVLQQSVSNLPQQGWMKMGSSGNESHFPYYGLVYADFFDTSRWINGVTIPGTVMRPHAFAVSCKSGSWRSFYNGELFFANTSANAPAWPSGPKLSNPGFDSGSSYFLGNFYLLAFFNRFLTDGEQAELGRNPFALFEPEDHPIYFTSAPPAGLSANPARGGGAAINPIWGMAA